MCILSYTTTAVLVVLFFCFPQQQEQPLLTHPNNNNHPTTRELSQHRLAARALPAVYMGAVMGSRMQFNAV
jgi:hypothetical protein